MNEEIKPTQAVNGPGGRPVFTNFGTIEDIKARLRASLLAAKTDESTDKEKSSSQEEQ